MRSSFDGFDTLAGPNSTEKLLNQKNNGKHTQKKHSAGKKSGGAAAAPAFDLQPLVDAILEEQRRAREEAYRAAEALLQAQRKAREDAYRAASAEQLREYQYAQGQVNDTTDRALQEAYINKMLSLRDLPQQLSAQGLSGGASETSTAGLYNNYGNARNQLELGRQQEMGQLLNVYQQNMAKLEAQRMDGAAADLAKLAPQLMNLTKLATVNVPATITRVQSIQKKSEDAMRRLRRALGEEEEETA